MSQEESPAVYKAIAAVMNGLGKEGISKDQKNASQGYKFRGIDDVYASLNGFLSLSNLVILPRALARTCEVRQSAKGGDLYYVTVDMEFDIVSAEDGSKHTVRTFGEAMDSGDKATNKAMSASYKYMAFQTFCIPVEGDNDADATTHQLAPRTQTNAPPVADGEDWLRSIGFKDQEIIYFQEDALNAGGDLVGMATEARQAGCKTPVQVGKYMEKYAAVPV